MQTAENGHTCQLRMTLCKAQMTPMALAQSPPAMLFTNPTLRFSSEPTILTAEDARTWPSKRITPAASSDHHTVVGGRHPGPPVRLVVSHVPDRFACRADLGLNQPETQTAEQSPMKVADAIKQMSKLPLQRIVDSFTKDFPKPDEDQARDIILRNVEELTDGKRITTVLQFDGPFKDQIRQILDAGGVREPARLVGVGAGNRREPDPPGAGRARRRGGGRQPALRGSRSHRNPKGRTQDSVATTS